jgi:hypothetical protein
MSCTRTPNLFFTPTAVQLAGDSSDNVTWHLSVDFSALGWTNLQKLWLTFAPALANSSAYASTEWSVTVSNWTVTRTQRCAPTPGRGAGVGEHRGRRSLGGQVRLLGVGPR